MFPYQLVLRFYYQTVMHVFSGRIYSPFFFLRGSCTVCELELYGPVTLPELVYGNRNIGCMLMQVQRCIHVIIFCDIQCSIMLTLLACSSLYIVCGVSIGVRVFTEQLVAVFNSCNAALTSVPAGYLRMICLRDKRHALSGCIQRK